jgi:solute carrier family 35 (UDP-sugar transporter), member A1/2/3
MHYSRIMPVAHGRYFTSTAVVLSEVSKLLFCLTVVVVVFIRKKANEGRTWSFLWSEILGGDAWKLSIPAGLYTVVSSFTILTLLVSASE